MNADKQNQVHQQLVQHDRVENRLATHASNKQPFSPKTHTTVYDNETNTHWEVADGQSVEDIRGLIKSFKANE